MLSIITALFESVLPLS